jgi:hypothetical protein
VTGKKRSGRKRIKKKRSRKKRSGGKKRSKSNRRKNVIKKIRDFLKNQMIFLLGNIFILLKIGDP